MQGFENKMLKIEKKWQKKWEKAKIFEPKEDLHKEKFYVLEMYPYPSASYLHMGHVRCYTIGDVFARTKRMQGFNVLYPIGYDSFGLPAETAAKKDNIHPRKYTEQSIAKITEYLKALGNSYAWGRTLASHEPEYYRWNQYFFLKMLEKGLAYRKKASVNWCETCQSVLANEESEGGKCWRCDSDVVKKDLDQWFFKITKYADRLLEDLNKIEWPEKIKTMQRNWIGKSEGLIENWQVDGMNLKLSTFTTMPHTTYGASFMVIAPEHPIVLELVKDTKYEKGAKEFIVKCKKARIEDPENIEKQKEGFFIGRFVLNHLNNRKMPLYIANFAIMDYGTGIVKCTPTHDQRDFEFAKKYKLGFYPVINPPSKKLDPKTMKEAYTNLSVGTMVDAGKFTGMDAEKAKTAVADYTVKISHGQKTTNYKIRDWMISRQRFWGTPIPVIYCDKCGVVPVPEKDLPVLLPEKADFKISGNPLAGCKNFVNTKCPKCKGYAKRETDTMGGFVDSSWYFLRYCDNKNKTKPFDEKKVNYWMPVDQYVGGQEHAVMHLLYARFFVKVLKDLGFVKFDEPFMKLFNQGIVYKDGEKMSKSKGNVVFQTDISNKYGIDTARLFLMFVSSPDKQMEWTDEGVEGSYRIITKIIRLSDKIENKKIDERFDSKIHSAIKKITEYIATFDYPKAIVSIISVLDSVHDTISKSNYEILLKLLHPFCPHITEEMWEKIGNKSFLSTNKWPVCDEKKINPKFDLEEKAIEKISEDINQVLKLIGKDKKITKAFIYYIPGEKELYVNATELVKKKTGLEIKFFVVNDKAKYDPQNKAGKTKPGKPAIYLE